MSGEIFDNHAQEQGGGWWAGKDATGTQWVEARDAAKFL